jgi:hypothetical protein
MRDAVDWAMVERRWTDVARAMLAVYLALAVVATVLSLARHADNNFLIFRGAFDNLLAGRDLYAAYPDRYADRFKYSPTFALLFAPFALLPVALGLLCWNAVNALSLGAALVRLLPPRHAVVAMAIALPELLGNLQNAQSNALISALVIAAHLALDAERPIAAAGAIAMGTFVKIFPVLAAALALLRPRVMRFVAAALAVFAALAMLPLLVIRPGVLAAQYASWVTVERADALAGVAAPDPWLVGSVMQQIRLWTGVHWANWPIQLVGVALLVLPLAIRPSAWSDPAFRRRALASVLVYMVIFNHQAEPPSFVIAMTGVGIWYVTSARRPIDRVLLGACLVLVSLAASSLVPGSVRREVMRYGVKAIPCIAVWIVLQLELLGLRADPRRVEAHRTEPAQELAHGI